MIYKKKIKKMYFSIISIAIGITGFTSLFIYNFIDPLPTEPYNNSIDILIIITYQIIFCIFFSSLLRLSHIKKINRVKLLFNSLLFPMIPLIITMLLVYLDYVMIRDGFIRVTLLLMINSFIDLLLISVNYLRLICRNRSRKGLDNQFW